MNQMAPVSVRMTAQERELLESAAELTHTSLSDFIRRKAVEAAEMAIMERRNVVIPAEKWEEFEVWAKSPAKNIPELRKLAVMRPAWED